MWSGTFDTLPQYVSFHLSIGLLKDSRSTMNDAQRQTAATCVLSQCLFADLLVFVFESKAEAASEFSPLSLHETELF